MPAGCGVNLILAVPMAVFVLMVVPMPCPWS